MIFTTFWFLIFGAIFLPIFCAAAAVFAMGMLTGVFVHYTLHRLILSSEPFIYVIF